MNNLQINKLYQIVVVAVNVNTNYRSKSSAVYIETLVNENRSKVNSPYTSIKDLPFLKGRAKEIGNTESMISKKSAATNTTNATTTAMTATENFSIGHDDELLTADQIKKIEDPNLLNTYLTKYQDDWSKSLLEYEQFQESSRLEELEILESLSQYRKEFEEESDLKSKIDNSIKDIEKTKDTLTFSKSKLYNQLKTLVTTKDLHQSNLDSLRQQLTKLEEKNKTLQLKSKQDSKDLNQRISSLTIQLNKSKVQNDLIENEIKDLGIEKKKLEKLLSTVKPLMDVLSKELSFTREGTLKPNFQGILNELFDRVPEWKQEILEELDKTTKNEIEWKHVFKSEIRKYLSIKQSLEIAKANKNKNHQPMLTKLSEYQVSLEFGGYANALPKTNHKPLKQGKEKLVSPTPIVHSSSTNSANANVNDIGSSLIPVVSLGTANGLTSSGVDVGGLGENGETAGGWHNFYSQVYSNDSNEIIPNPSLLLPQTGMEDFDPTTSAAAIHISRVGTPLQQLRMENGLDNLSLHDNSSTNIQTQLPSSNTTTDYNNYQYQPLSSATTNHVWNSSPSLATNTMLANDHYVGLNALGYDSNHHLPTNGSGGNGGAGHASGVTDGGNSSGVTGSGADLYHSLNQSGASFNNEIPLSSQLGSSNLIRSTVFQQFKGLDLAQTSPPYINYTSPSPVPSGFMMSPTASNNGPANNIHGHLPADSQNDILHVTDSLSIPTNTDIQALSPQLNHIPLNSLWSPLPYGHTRNVLNHSQSQIWRNDETNFGTTLSDYNKRTTSSGAVTAPSQEKNPPPYTEETY